MASLLPSVTAGRQWGTAGSLWEHLLYQWIASANQQNMLLKISLYHNQQQIHKIQRIRFPGPKERHERETALTPDPQFHCLARDPKYCGLAGTTGNVAPRKTNWLALGGNDTRCSVYKRRTHPAALWLIIVQRWACNFRVYRQVTAYTCRAHRALSLSASFPLFICPSLSLWNLASFSMITAASLCN